MNTRRPQPIPFRDGLPEAGRQSGFTLIEVLVAISILSFGLLAIATMQITAIQTTGKAKSVGEGTSWAEDRTEYLMSLDYSDPILTATAYVPVPGTPPAGYTIDYQVLDGDPRPNCKAIYVKTTWSDRGTDKVSIIRSIKPQL